MQTLSKLSVVAGFFAAAVGLTAAMAQEQNPQQPSSGMMQGQGMMPMMDMMQQMTKMMEACNSMMQARKEERPAAKPPVQPQSL
jgi:hypothetical protein